MKVFLNGLFILIMGQVAHAKGILATVSQIGDTVHLEFQGLNLWDYDIEKKTQKNKLLFFFGVPPLSRTSVEMLEKWKSPLIEGLSVSHNGVDGKDVISVKFAQTNVEAFDYLTDQPPRLIIDMYRDPLVPEAVSSKRVKSARREYKQEINENKNKLKSKSEFLDEKKKEQRQPSSTDFLDIKTPSVLSAGASLSKGKTVEEKDESGGKESGIFDAGDPRFERFEIKDYEIQEDSIIASRENYYINFPMLRIENDQLAQLQASQPIYEIIPDDGSDENKQSRLMIKLYQNKRYNVFIKAIEWFNKKFPNSKYDEMLRFVWADAHFSLWIQNRDVKDFDSAMTRYRQAIEKYPKSVLMERTQLLMGFASLDRGDYLGTLRLFQKHIQDLPKSVNRDLARLAIADALLKLSQYSDAEKLYGDIANESDPNQIISKKHQIAAAYMVGDVIYKQGETTNANDQDDLLKKAIELYKSALNKYPKESGDYPNAFYNQAAAYFKLRQPKEAIRVYLDFLKKFPNHEYAGYAMTRVGELLDMMGAEKSRAIGAYLETQFRYGNNPSSLVARLRLLLSRMKDMRQKELDKAIADVSEMIKESHLPDIGQFSHVLISDGYSNRGEYGKAIEYLVQYYQAHPTTANTAMLNSLIIKNINLEIKSFVKDGKFIEALRAHSKYADNRLKNSDRIDTKYNVAMAFEQAGVFSEAEKLYRNSLNQMLSLKGTKDEKARSIFERLPSTDQVELRLAKVYMQLGDNAQSYEHMKSIGKPELLSEKEQIERIQVGAYLLERKGELASAARHLVELIKTWSGVPQLIVDPYFQLANIEDKLGKKNDAIESLRKIDQLMTESENKISIEVHYKALKKMGDLFFEQGQMDESLSVYEKLLKLYEDKYQLPSIRYRVGQIYFSRGELQKSAEYWNLLKNQKNSEFWYKLSQEQLKNFEWSNDYKKYIKRIPAMSEKKL